MYIDRYTHSLSKYSVYSPQKKKEERKEQKKENPTHSHPVGGRERFHPSSFSPAEATVAGRGKPSWH